jgi:hypothetical protein
MIKNCTLLQLRFEALVVCGIFTVAKSGINFCRVMKLIFVVL